MKIEARFQGKTSIVKHERMESSPKQPLCPHIKFSHNDDLGNFERTTGILACLTNSFFILPSVVLNLVLILGIIKTPAFRKPSYILICSLAVTDLGVGVLIQPLFVARKVALMHSYFEVYCHLLGIGNILAHIFCSPSFFVVTAISVDRYLAVRLQTRYKQVITNRKAYKVLFACLIGSCLVTLARYHATKPEHMLYAGCLMLTLLVIISYCYVKSLKMLNSHQLQMMKIRTSSQNFLNAILHKRTLKTLLIVVTALFLCYIPFMCVVLIMSRYGRNRALTIAWDVTITLVFLNSFINPVLHLCRCKQLKQACLSLVRRYKIVPLKLQYEPGTLRFSY